jgi:serine/threonine protein kinase
MREPENVALPLIAGRYRLTRKLISGDQVRGIPDLWKAEDAGDTYYVKLWKRVGDDSIDIKALWNREVRGLTRLQGYPGAAEFFVRLHDLSFDPKNYYAILEGGKRLPLSEVLKERSRWPWLSNLGDVGRRRPIWEGLLRVAEALHLLHRDGTLHRSLTTSAVFVGQDGLGDFRLSGFEWSLRIAGDAGAAAKVGRTTTIVAPELERVVGEYSIATDWFDFGLILAEVFGAPVRTAKKREAIRVALAQSSNLRDAERGLILDLLDENEDDRIAAAEQVVQNINDLVRDIGAATSGFGRNLVLAVRLTRENKLSSAVQSASAGKAPVDRPAAQLDWIRNDLRGDPRVTARNEPKQQFVVRGEQLEYVVRPWRLGASETWDVGFCESLESVPSYRQGDQHFGLGQRKLEVIGYPDVSRTVQTIRGRSMPWSRVFTFAKSKPQLDPHLKDILDFFRITQQLDTVLTAAQICPVEIVEMQRTQTETVVQVTPREDPARNTLAALLKLSPPSEQFREWFDIGTEPTSDDGDVDPSHDTYELLERPILGVDGPTPHWTFVDGYTHPDGPRYEFRCAGMAPVSKGIYFLARNHGGTITQIKRRHKAIEDMHAHEGLLRLLADPAGSSRKSGESLPEARIDIPLDESKTEALRQLWQTQPSFAIQGPPGTGKTTLIKAFTDRLFSTDPSAQVLLTAHSHHTVDDVRSKLDEMFACLPPRQKPILIRLGSKSPTDHDIGPVTERLLSRLKSSELAKRMPLPVQDRLERILPSDDGHDEVAKNELRAVQMLVQDAANLTFTTLNSFELAESSARGRRFDWSVIEEAGKAHGFDMSLALEQSHRLLLIGDHFQLPPFNSKVFKQLLGDPLRVKKAIITGERFAPGLVDASIVDEEEGREMFAERCDRWMRMVDIFARFFENSIGENKEVPGPAATLTDQHRMHPTIASLVGEVFYPDGKEGTILVSPPETHARFAGDPPFIIRPGSWLPDERIVWCNVPWKQNRKFAKGESDGVFASPTETRAVVKVLAELAPRGEIPCEIQILSPYNDQLDMIRDAIQTSRRGGELASMFEPTFDMAFRKRLGATVDEFQGSEADIVIVSLVRNNPLPPWASVGFLKEANRMNVLLSRARHKLIIIGSWDFFKSRVTNETPADAEYAYIGRMMGYLEAACDAGSAKRVDIV